MHSSNGAYAAAVQAADAAAVDRYTTVRTGT
jgi:hypothetical protein